MKWKKVGICYSLDKLHPKLLSHCANPLPLHLEGDIYRIYFSSRDEVNRSSVGAVDIDIVKNKIVTEHIEPFFIHGEESDFFSDGVSVGDTYTVGNKTYMLFMGWKVPRNNHWYGQIGRLQVLSDGRLVLDSNNPLIEIDKDDPLSLSYPCIHKVGDVYHMWYGSTLTWDAGNNEMVHILKHAQSRDGNTWQKCSHRVPFQIGVAQAFSRPSILKIKDLYHLYFSYRCGTGTSYRIGNATSKNALNWNINERNIHLSKHGWDSEMLEYPYIFKHDEKFYMLYNGNDYGKSGFGLAVMTSLQT